MKTDDDLRSDAESELEWKPGLDEPRSMLSTLTSSCRQTT
jgi:hypothetical protein